VPIIKNSVLKGLQALLGYAPSSTPTNIDDSAISLTLPLVPEISRRSYNLFQSGWFFALMENVHSGADGETSALDPYQADAGPTLDASLNGFPGAVPQGWDIWLLGVSGIRSSGAGGLTGATCEINPIASQQGIGLDDVGTVVTGSPPIHVAFFDEINADVADTSSMMRNSTNLQTYVKVGLRIPRGAIIEFTSEAAAAAEFRMMLTMGIFPEALGQDVAS